MRDQQGAAADRAGDALDVQVSNTTRPDRYPAVFSAVAQAAGGMQQPRILSYGCSTGEEPYTLATKYFQTAQIVGLDVSAEALAAARERNADQTRVTIAESTRETLSALGPYDIIFAMSVLCRWPTTRRMDNIAELFPFARFVDQVATLDAVLRPGGLLVIYNANYEFLHTPVAADYDLVLSPRIRTAGQVKKFRPDGAAAGPAGITCCIYRKRPPAEAGSEGLVLFNERLVCLGEIPRGLPSAG
jgi:SAM-dependent methyltransferase